MDKKIEDRYFGYILTYVNTILELWQELEEKCKKIRSGDITISRKKYMYFATKNGVTLINKHTNLELTFLFNHDEKSIYFEKDHIENYIESDLNTSGLWKNFPSNQNVRIKLYNECLDKLLLSGVIQKKDSWFTIHKEEKISIN